MKYIIWTEDKCKNEALRYNSKREFSMKSASAYNYARHNNILDNVCLHMINKRKSSGYWTYERCKEDALKYKTRNEYRIKSGSSYDRAWKSGWLDNICLHMELVGNRYKRCIYAYEFSDNNVYVGLTHNLDERQKIRNYDISDSVTKHINKTGLTPVRKQLSDYIDINSARKLEGDIVYNYKNDGWSILNKCKTGGIGGNYLRWTKDRCMGVALLCKNKKEFYNDYRNAYSSALRNGWISSIYVIFNTSYHKKFIYNKESCGIEALKYKTKREFKINCRGMYEASLRNGWHDEICKHMTYLNKIWTKEKCQNVVIKCKTKKEFRKKYGGAYHATIRNQWMGEFFIKI